jgi:hypothetical protein
MQPAVQGIQAPSVNIHPATGNRAAHAMCLTTCSRTHLMCHPYAINTAQCNWSNLCFSRTTHCRLHRRNRARQEMHTLHPGRIADANVLERQSSKAMEDNRTHTVQGFLAESAQIERASSRGAILMVTHLLLLVLPQLVALPR